jgi:replicative DNA helicase
MIKTYPQPPGRVPPNSVEAEEQLLSAIFLDSADVLGRCAEAKIAPESFYVPANRELYALVRKMTDEGKPVDLCTVAEELKTAGKLDELGGYAYLTRVSGRIPTTAGASYFIEKVSELSLLRDLIRAGTGAVEDCYNYTGGINELADKVESNLMAVTQRRIKGEQKHISETAKRVMEKMRQMVASKGAVMGLPTGFMDLDRILYGLNAPDLIILAGRPSCGKTALALNIAENVAMHVKRRANVMVFSMEMSEEQLVQRMMCCRATVLAARVKSGLCSPDEMDRLAEVEQEIAGSGLVIDDSSALTVLELRARARRVHQKTPLGLIIVDYLQLMSGTDSKAFREAQIAECSRGLKAMAKELNVPVIALSQFNRSSEKENRRPRLSDLRESGSIEQDADVVLMLNRPKSEDDIHQVAAEKMELIIGKNRNGAVDDILLTFQGSITRFSNYLG